MERGHVGDRQGPGHWDRLLGWGTHAPRACFQTLTLNPIPNSCLLDIPGHRVPSLCKLYHCPPATNHSPASHSASSQPCCRLRASLLAAPPRSSASARGPKGHCHLHPTSGDPAPHSMHPQLGVRPPAQPHCPPGQGPLGLPPAHTLAWARRRRPRRERKSRRNRRAASGTSTARSCRSRLWDRDRTSRSCEGTDGQMDKQMGGGVTGRERTHGQRGKKDGGEGLESPWAP